MNKNTFISDQFNVWKKCRKKYYYKYIRNLNWPEFQSDYHLGKSVHALINYHLKGFSTDILLKNADNEIIERWNLIKGHPLLKMDVIATEWAFNSKISGTNHWLKGRIDAILYDKEQKKYLVIDWKTGENIPKKPEDNFQHVIYLNAFFNSQKDLKIELSQEDLIFQYVKITDKIEILPISYSENIEREYSLILTEIINEIENSKEYEAVIPCRLKNCRYHYLCVN